MPRNVLIYWVAIFSFVIMPSIAVAKGMDTVQKQVFNIPGSFPSPDKYCIAILETSQVGGHLELQVVRGSRRSSLQKMNNGKIEDITGIVWLDKKTLVFTTSPVYGRPGLYEMNCETTKVTRLVEPQTINKAYPDGADYFEMQRVSGNIVYYYYGADVDGIDFKSFRRKESLRKYIFHKQ